MVCEPAVIDAVKQVATPVAGTTGTDEQPLIADPLSVKATVPESAVPPEGVAVTVAVNVTC